MTVLAVLSVHAPLDSAHGLLWVLIALGYGALVGAAVRPLSRGRTYLPHNNIRIGAGALIIMYAFVGFLGLLDHFVYGRAPAIGTFWILTFPPIIAYGISIGYRFGRRGDAFPPVTPMADE